MAAMSSTGRTPGEHPRWRGSPHDSRDQTPDDEQLCRRGAPLGRGSAQTVAENADTDSGCLQEALKKIEEMESTAQQAQEQGPIASQEVDYHVDTPPTNADMNFVIEMRDTTSSATRWVLAKNDALEAERRLRVEAERRVAEYEAIPRLMHEALNKLREKELAVTRRLCADFDRDHAKMERMLASERERRCQAKVERESFASSMVYAGKSSIHQDDSLSHVDYRNKTAESIKLKFQKLSPWRVTGRSNVRNPESELNLQPFENLKTECGDSMKLNKSFLELNRERRKEIEQSKRSPEIKYLRSGMVLLKNCISHQDQVQIIKRCQQLGLGCGGFYRPDFRDGVKSHLHMMCLGKNWDPQTGEYEDIRSFDGATPPKIPEEFTKLVHKAIQISHEFLQQYRRGSNVEDELPMMAPDICIVNFYSNSGQLGLHQDRDESKKSIDNGLPVVSFSLGDSAEFLYGEGRDVDKAEKVELESGDVLIFGGKSRLLFHGVPSIIPNTAPTRLIDDTKLKPGRLNLTFRQYLA